MEIGKPHDGILSYTYCHSLLYFSDHAAFKITRHPCIPGEEEAEGEEFICLMGL